MYQRSQEAIARKNVILKLLRKELGHIGDIIQPYDVNKGFYRDPIRLSAPTRLLDGDILEFRTNLHLIELLLMLQVAISRYNDFVSMTNMAQASVAIQDNTHAQWYNDVKNRFQAITSVRNEIIEYVGSE